MVTKQFVTELDKLENLTKELQYLVVLLSDEVQTGTSANAKSAYATFRILLKRTEERSKNVAGFIKKQLK